MAARDEVKNRGWTYLVAETRMVTGHKRVFLGNVFFALAIFVCALPACFTPRTDDSHPLESISVETLLSDVPLEFLGGPDLGIVSMHRIHFFEEEGLAIYLDRGSTSPGFAVLLAARFEQTEEGTVIFLGESGGQIVAPVIPSERSSVISAVWYVFSVEVDIDHADGRRDSITIDIDSTSNEDTIAIEYERSSAPSVGPFGRSRLHFAESEAMEIVRMPHLIPGVSCYVARPINPDRIPGEETGGNRSDHVGGDHPVDGVLEVHR